MTQTTEIPVTPESKRWHDGWKGLSGSAVVVVTILASLLGYDVREAFPVEFARFGEELILLVGGILAFYGRYAAKGDVGIKKWFKRR